MNRVQVYESQLPAYGHLRKLKHYNEMRKNIGILCQPGKGLLAADESVGSVTKRFAPLKLENNAQNRQRYRALMVAAPGVNAYLSGVIYHEETLTQQIEGKTFAAYTAALGIVPGIKTDLGLSDLNEGAPGEQCTNGLDGYLARAQKFYAAGARFCKWRNVYKIQNGTVSEQLVRHNAETLARYTILSQKAGLVPIVEPEVMIDGDHSIEVCAAVSEHVWSAVVTALKAHGVCWEVCLLKPNMVVAGAEFPGGPASPSDVAKYTVKALSRTIPAALPGIFFLSGGLSEVQASEYLNAINDANLKLPRPWRITFSFARALQASALTTWAGKEETVVAARKVLLHRCLMNSKASDGKYQRSEDDKASASLYVKGHTY